MTLFLRFDDNSDAGSATIVNNNILSFQDNSNSSFATIDNKSSLTFTSSSLAGYSTINNHANIEFYGTATAEDAVITNHNSLSFSESSKAGNAHIDNLSGSTLAFAQTSNAENATINNQAGGTVILDTSISSIARLINNGSVALGPSGKAVTIGSIEGAGSFDLRHSNFTVGTNNLSTTFSGSIGSGALTKVGTGTLTVTGSMNSLSDTVQANGGVLRLEGLSKSAVAINAGGTLGGSGTITGALTANNGGTLAPGASAGQLKSASATLNAGSNFAVEIGGTSAGAGGYDQLAVTGTVTIGAANLSASLINGFSPSLTARQSFVIIDNDGTDAVVGTFGSLGEGAKFLVGDWYFTISYAGGTGNDVVLTSGGANRVGTEGNDVLGGTAFEDTIDGRGGIDAADYSFLTGGMKVTLKNGIQHIAGDTLTSIEGIFGGSGNDTFKGTAKANIFRGGGGKDSMDGAGGADTVDYGDKTKKLVLTLDGSHDVTVKIGNKAEDHIKNFENVTGGSAGDKLGGDSKANVLNGGLGKDQLSGGAAGDKFVFSTALGAANIDTITDFKPGQDKILLDDAIFSTIGKLEKGEFYARDNAKAAHDGDDRIIYDTKSGKLYYDADGKDGPAPAVQFAVISNHAGLGFHDFAIV